jgi:hypothetical protein
MKPVSQMAATTVKSMLTDSTVHFWAASGFHLTAAELVPRAFLVPWRSGLAFYSTYTAEYIAQSVQ